MWVLFYQVRPADTPRETATSDSSCVAFFEMPNVLGSAGSWSFVLSNRWGCGGLARSAGQLSQPAFNEAKRSDDLLLYDYFDYFELEN